eukprot:135661_1
MASVSKSLRVILGTMAFGGQADMAASERMVQMYLSHGNCEVDTATMYGGSKSERYLGEMEGCHKDPVRISSKINNLKKDCFSRDSVIDQVDQSLKRLQLDKLDILYLHWPDYKTSIKETLGAINELHQRGKFNEFGLSNYASWQVMDIWHICNSNGWVLPTVFQGMYSAITRSVEGELFPCLRSLGIRFYAYSPLGGGFLTGKHVQSDVAKGRFHGNKWGKKYRERYWYADNFDALERVKLVLSESYGDSVSCAEASLRWVMHHSKLSPEHGDGIVIGASSPKHLESNLMAIKGGPLNDDVVEAFENIWRVGRVHCPNYYR